MKATRKDVYAAIDSEREYQDRKWNAETTTSGGKHDDLAAWVLFMEHYLSDAKKALSTTAEQDSYPVALAAIRKVAGLCVAAMEQHGAPKR